ncbi:MAG TPA: dolichyl-phosphate beta-glucosyltransferase [Thermoanaerobaculia bacterium]|nr:dolichyl-phosphate beta-glucosyltransferase [Thermoanaerobaculia bacterium]
MRGEGSVSIIIPAYNEAARIGDTIRRLLAYRHEPDAGILEIIVVDDGSRDGTTSIVKSMQAEPALRLISYGANAGKGYAIRRGVVEAKGDLILLSDADLSTPIEELVLLRHALKTADIAIGSRAIDPAKVRIKQNKLRRRLGITFNRLLKVVTGLPFGDTQCGFKLLPREAARKIFSIATIDRFAYDVEMLMIAKSAGYSVAEVPVLWFNSENSRVRIVRDSLRMFIDVLLIRRRLGSYGPASQD